MPQWTNVFIGAVLVLLFVTWDVRQSDKIDELIERIAILEGDIRKLTALVELMERFGP